MKKYEEPAMEIIEIEGNVITASCADDDIDTPEL